MLMKSLTRIICIKCIKEKVLQHSVLLLLFRAILKHPQLLLIHINDKFEC